MKMNLANIKDPILLDNLRTIQKFLQTESVFAGFEAFTATIPGATTSSFQVAHGLGFAPQDVVLTSLIGSGVVTFQYALFDKSFLYLTSTGPAVIRGLAGTFQTQAQI